MTRETEMGDPTPNPPTPVFLNLTIRLLKQWTPRKWEFLLKAHAKREKKAPAREGFCPCAWDHIETWTALDVLILGPLYKLLANFRTQKIDLKGLLDLFLLPRWSH